MTQSVPAAARAKRTLLLIAAIGLAPITASYAVYYFWPRQAHVNYGELLATRQAPAINGVRADGRPFRLAELRGRWVLLMSSPAPCDVVCERMLYATRQARTIQGGDQDRVLRVWLVTSEGDASPALLAQHRGLEVVRVEPATVANLPGGNQRIHLIDPLGNWVLAWPSDPDIKALAKDLGRVLRVSQIG
ncbi:MAG TPA: hypothetical protein VGL25_17630 [Casimicrobiaceae bacterium]